MPRVTAGQKVPKKGCNRAQNEYKTDGKGQEKREENNLKRVLNPAIEALSDCPVARQTVASIDTILKPIQ